MNQFEIMVGLDKKDAFEGWFSKIDDPANGLMFSVIWGYSTHRETKHAFIQFQDNLKHESKYVAYPMEELSWTTHPFVLQIGKNRLTEKSMHLELEKDEVRIFGDFSFGALAAIKRSILKPNIMGWLTYFPNECNHSIISMDHTVQGSLTIGEHSWQIRDAHGYMEKDWGTGFPKEYVWAQVNDWEKSSLAFGYATVPMLGKHAKGFFLVLHHEGKEYRFSSIECSKMFDFQVTQDSFAAIIKKGDYLLHLKAKQFNPVMLASPTYGEMKSYIKESLDGRLELLLEKNNEEIVSLSSDRASIDVHF